MSASSQVPALRAELRETAEMIRRAFPDGVPDSAYRPLLALLYEGMSFRGLAEVVAHYTAKPYAVVYNDVLGAVSEEGPSASSIDAVRQTLQQHGYDEWLAKTE